MKYILGKTLTPVRPELVYNRIAIGWVTIV